MSSFCVRNPFQPRYLKINYWNFIKIFFFSFKCSSSELSAVWSADPYSVFTSLSSIVELVWPLTPLFFNKSSQLVPGLFQLIVISTLWALVFNRECWKNKILSKSWVYFLKNSFKIQKKKLNASIYLYCRPTV